MMVQLEDEPPLFRPGLAGVGQEVGVRLTSLLHLMSLKEDVQGSACQGGCPPQVLQHERNIPQKAVTVEERLNGVKGHVGLLN